ncbi:CotH kinase family protein [Streptomyces sp. NPDC058052]|uniref:CotH kinase family protein n=1 Tax=Streptomyces sp. NPDC058052 TaxID=3346316 RepID=UPI0036EE649B
MTGPTTARQRRRRLKDRLPVRLRHHWKPGAALGIGLAAMVVFLGDVRISPYVTSASRVEGDPITEDVKGTVGLYDATVPHSIQLTYKQTDFDRMMKEFTEDGTKDYIEADLVIDGVHLDDVGIRLKGNSTLSSLRGARGMPGGMPGGGRGGAGFPQAGTADADGGAGAGGGAGGQEGRQSRPGAGAGAGVGAGAEGGTGGDAAGTARAPGAGGAAPGGMVQYDLSADKPEELPWLVKIDEYVEGRAYQGEREISLRPGSEGQVPLNEALSLSLTARSGQKAERFGFTELKVNDRPSVARLMVEAPDTDYADDIGDGDGVLYKAKASGSFTYRGDDPSEYEDSFKQLNKKGSQDLEPVMKLVKWADRASDEEFARDLHMYVDVDSLASYLAAQNLLLNFDDMSGPGKNYLLRYDLDTKKFSVLGWDYNLTFNGDAAAGPDDTISMGGGMRGAMPAGGGTGGTGGTRDPEATGGTGGPQEGFPEGMPEGMPEGFPGGAPGGETGGAGGFPGGAEGGLPPMPGQGEGPGGEGGPGGRGGMQHVLKTKFLASDAFDGVYKKAYRELYETFYGSGTAERELKAVAAQARSAGAGSRELDDAVARLTKTVTDRTAALAENEDVTG